MEGSWVIHTFLGFHRWLQVTYWLLIVAGDVLTAEQMGESSQPTGNYTIRITVYQNGATGSNNKRFKFRLVGEIDTGSSALSIANCRDSEVKFTGIDDIGRICSINLTSSDCYLDQITIKDNQRDDVAVFNISSQLVRTEKIYERSGQLQRDWRNWSVWQNCNCGTGTKLRTRTCVRPPSQCGRVIPCAGDSEEKASCVCQTPQDDESAASDQVVVIPIIVSIGAILLIIVVAAVCYSRRMNKRAQRLRINCPEIIITPPEETLETEKSTLSPKNNNPHNSIPSEHSKLMSPDEYSNDDVTRKPTNDIEWETNDLYVSAGP